jgi:hypothetical protein
MSAITKAYASVRTARRSLAIIDFLQFLCLANVISVHGLGVRRNSVAGIDDVLVDRPQYAL